MFSFWNDFLQEKFTEEGDGVLLCLDRLERTITGTFLHTVTIQPSLPSNLVMSDEITFTMLVPTFFWFCLAMPCNMT